MAHQEGGGVTLDRDRAEVQRHCVRGLGERAAEGVVRQRIVRADEDHQRYQDPGPDFRVGLDSWQDTAAAEPCVGSRRCQLVATEHCYQCTSRVFRVAQF